MNEIRLFGTSLNDVWEYYRSNNLIQRINNHYINTLNIRKTTSYRLTLALGAVNNVLYNIHQDIRNRNNVNYDTHSMANVERLEVISRFLDDAINGSIPSLDL